MRSLVVTKFVPTPPTNGGRLRSLAMVEHLAERGPVTVCAFGDGTEDPAQLEDRGIKVVSVPWRHGWLRRAIALARTASLSTAHFWSAELAAAVRSEAEGVQFDLLQIEHTQMLPYARLAGARRRVLDLHNVESELFRSRAATAGLSRPALRLEARALARTEAAARREFDAVIVVSDLERQRLAGEGGTVLVCPNGWVAGPELPPADEPVAAFVALMGWEPNADAACWLVEEIWPHVRARVPAARLLLVGRDPTPRVRALASSDVCVTGTVPDVSPYLAQARVALAPLRAGGGSRLKILEALSAGRPVVATPIGAEGFEDLVGKGVVIGQTAEQLGNAVAELLGDPAPAVELGRAGRAAVVEHHGWPNALRELSEWLG